MKAAQTLSRVSHFEIGVRALLVVFCLLSGVPTAFAFGEAKPEVTDVKDPLVIESRLQPSSVEAGGTVDLTLQLHLAKNYHAYLERFKLVIESPDDLKLAPFKIDPIVKFMDTVSKAEKQGVAGDATLHALIEVPVGFSPGQQNVKLKLTYQACAEDHCLFPKSLPVVVALTVKGAAAASITPHEPTLEPNANTPADFQSALQKGTLWAFLLMFGVGFLTSLTPCVYPMIPITLAVLGARSKGQSHFKNFSIAVVYVLGISVTYSSLGILAATTGTLFGSALSNRWVVSAIAFVFVAMGLSMFGLFEIQAPGVIRNKLGGARKSTGYSGAFVTGLIAGIVASPCIGPVLVSVLTYIAQTKSQVLGFFLLFTFSFGMGLPFIALGLSSSAISRIPKAGAWMEIVKFVFGTLMIGMAFFYILPLYPAWLFRALLGVAMVLLAGEYGAFITMGEEATGAMRARKAVMILVFILGCVEFLTGVLEKQGLMLGGGSLVASTLGSAAPAAASGLAWKPYSEAALADALKSGKPVLIDFSAEWCGACKEMDRSTFTDPRVIDVSHGFNLLRVDGTEDSEALQALIARYKIEGFPTYIFYDGAGKEHRELDLFGYEDVEKFLPRLTKTAAAR